jgi:hypothetical protein
LKRLHVAIAAVLVMAATARCGPTLATIDAALPTQSTPAAPLPNAWQTGA